MSNIHSTSNKVASTELESIFATGEREASEYSPPHVGRKQKIKEARRKFQEDQEKKQ